ncbi:amidohydrolase family protein [Kocuria tytonis]|uniref:Amidohydrolase 3 domain-containing protein n=1 Tax=Kocuria tytonis TaxID=2054280 RepID=A0A495AA88_9MICC|nr:hypothetical protein [Kocuria tytonis]RKQ36324.1 hypothetical protein C1C97_001165 [Kocuria tytonis]
MQSQEPGTRVWVNGSVYSPADPFATAVLLAGATVAWLGSDDAARAMAGPGVTPGDLRAAVVTPAFVAHHRVPDRLPVDADAAGPGDDADAAPAPPRTSQGYGAVELLGSDPEALAAATERVLADGAHALPVLIRAATQEQELDASDLPSPALGLDAGTLPALPALRESAREHLVACTRAALQAVLVLPLTEGDPHGAMPDGAGAAASSGDDRLDALLEAAEAAQEHVGERAFRARNHRIVGVGGASEEQCRRMAALSLTASCIPGRAPLRDLSRAGVPVTLMTEDPEPWAAVKAALEAPHERLRTSARAAFLGLTRGAWRARPGAQPLAGQLVPGAEATLTVWDAESVMVQQAQGTGASWSTDPRARTPVLPALDDARLPRCEATVVAGRLVAGTEPRP